MRWRQAAGLGVVGLLLTACSSVLPAPPPTSPPSRLPRVANEVTVSDADSLRRALAVAEPGQTITLRDGAYSGRSPRGNDGSEPGRFVIDRPGQPDAVITLRGTRAAVLDGDGTGGGYVLHLIDVSYWRLEGFTASTGSKGIVLDGSSHNEIDNVRVTNIGDEGVHFRASSADNTIRNSEIDHTGMGSEGFGEGVYIGSAHSNWARHSGGRPDTSDLNRVLNNRIVDTRAEPIDVKEGTTGGVIRGNTLGGDAVAGKNSADSWIDVKGNGYRVENNRGQHAVDPAADPEACAKRRTGRFCNGFEVHTALDGWGRDNTFRGNVLEVNAPGVGIWLQNSAVDAGNVIGCDNQVVGAAAGAYATNHYQALACTP